MLDLLRSKRDPVDREGCGVPQNGGNRLVLERYGRNRGPVHWEGCGVPQNGTPRDTIHLHRRPPPASTSYCSSTVDLLQPPRAPVHPATTARYSTGYCSTTPPPSTVHPALHGVRPVHPALHEALFIQPQPSRSIGVLFIQRQHHGVLFIHPHWELFIQTPQQCSLFIQRQHRPASTRSSSEGIARSCSVNSHRSIAQV